MSRRLYSRCAAACLCLWSAGEASTWAADEPPSAPSSAPPAVAPPPEPASPKDAAVPTTPPVPAPVPTAALPPVTNAGDPSAADPHVGDPAAVDAAVTRALGPRCGEAGPLLRQAALTASAADRAFVERVLRLCASLPTSSLATLEGSSLPPAAAEPNRSGRGRLVVGATTYGLWVGIAVDVLLEVEDARAAVLPPLLGVGAGLTASLLATQEGEITRGQAWTIITGLDYGTFSGLLLAGAVDITDDPKNVVGSALVTGLIGGSVATVVATNFRPTTGDAEVLRSGGLWGTATAGLIAAAIQPADEQATFGLLLAGMDGGLLTGAIVAHENDISRDRMLIGDAGALAGAVAGFGLGILVLGTEDGEGRGIAITSLIGLHGGLGLSFWLTRNMPDEKQRTDEAEEARATPEHEPPAALWVRNENGAWHSGRLALQPTFDTTRASVRPVGASLTLLGGLW
jgi:hypothetical protein